MQRSNHDLGRWYRYVRGYCLKTNANASGPAVEVGCDQQGDTLSNRSAPRFSTHQLLGRLETLEPRMLFDGTLPSDELVVSAQTDIAQLAVPLDNAQLVASADPTSPWDGANIVLNAASGWNFWNSPTFNVTPSSSTWGGDITVRFSLVSASASSGTSLGVYLSPDSNVNTSDTFIINYGQLPATGNGISTASNISTNYTLPVFPPQYDPDEIWYIGGVLGNGNRATDSIRIPNIFRVTDDLGSPSDRLMDFGGVVDDGAFNSTQEATVTFTNTSNATLFVAQNGLSFDNGTHFRIKQDSVISNLRSTPIDLSQNFATIAPNGQETWTMTVVFDPREELGNLTDRLLINTLNGLTRQVDLSGTALPIADLGVTDASGDPGDRRVDFPTQQAGVETVTRDIVLTNTGSGPLDIAANGLSLPAGTPFTVTQVVSDVQGAIDLTAGPATLASRGTESWNVTVAYAPTAAGVSQAGLSIDWSDPNAAGSPTQTSTVTLLGQAVEPAELVAEDSALPAEDLAIAFDPTHIDGTGGQAADATIVLSNAGGLPLNVLQDGLVLADGTHFQVVSVVSDTDGQVDLGLGPSTLDPNGSERWTVGLRFDPQASGLLNDTLSIASDSLVNANVQLALSGTGLDRPALAIAVPDDTPADTTLDIADTLADGVGGRSGLGTVELTNLGNQPLVVAQDGIALLTGSAFSILSIESDLGGPIDLAAAPAAIAPHSSETWTVNVAFDPAATGPASDTLRIASNDPDQPAAEVAVQSNADTPQFTLTNIDRDLVASANRATTIAWLDAYSAGDATIDLYYDDDRDPSTGLVPIATGLSEDAPDNAYDWAVPDTLVGQTVFIYGVISDGSVSQAQYATGSITVEPADTTRLLSAPVTDESFYTLQYLYDGVTYSQDFDLQVGSNTLTHTIDAGNGPITHAFEITRVPTLSDQEWVTYNELGAVNSVTDSAGRVTTTTFDLLNRPVEIAYPDGQTVRFTYDVVGNLTSMADSSGWQFYGYDALDRLETVAYSEDAVQGNADDRTLTYAYNLANELTSLTYPSGKVVEYTYDAPGRVHTVTDKTAGQPDRTTTYHYSPTTGLLDSVVRPNNTQTLYTYDNDGRLTGIRHEKTDTSELILDIVYTLDASSRRTSATFTDADGTTAEKYDYSAFDEIALVTYSDDDGVFEATDRTVGYTYNLNGSRLTMTTDADGAAGPAEPETLTYTYGNENRLLRITDADGVVQSAFYYDWRGNLAAEVTPTQTKLYTFDDRDRLVAYEDGATYATYEYDGVGRRVAKTIDDAKTEFVLDVSTPIYQVVEDYSFDSFSSAYVYGIDRISGQLASNSENTYYLADGISSVRAILDDNGALAGTASYDVFGQSVTGSSTSVEGLSSFGFAGEQIDSESGLTYLRARMYQAETGRFLSKDGVFLAGGFDPYIYSLSNPTNVVDRDGNVPILAVTAGVGALAGAAIGGVVEGVSTYLDGGSTSDILGAAGAGALKGGAIGLAAGLGGGIGFGVAAPSLGATSTATTVVSSFAGATFADTTRASIEAGGLAAPDPFNIAVGTVTGFAGNKIAGTLLGGRGPGRPPNIFSTRPLSDYSSRPLVQRAVNESALGSPAGDLLNLGATAAGNAFGNYLSPSKSPNLVGDFPLPSLDSNKFPNAFNTRTAGLSPGGVLINEAATLIGSSLDTIDGVAFDPVSGQLIFLGTDDPAAVNDVNLDYLFTAIQSVYGSAVPPFVTLDPPMKMASDTFDVGAGANVLPAGASAKVLISYNPLTWTEDDDATLTFDIDGVEASAELNGWVMDDTNEGTQGTIELTAGGRVGMGLTLESTTGLPGGIELSLPPIGSDLLPNIVGNIVIQTGTATISGGQEFAFYMDARGQQSYWYATLTNNSGSAVTIDDFSIRPDLQHRGLSTRAEDSRLGWVMYEADRVMKNLGIGRDMLTGETYDKTTPTLPAGFENLLEKYQGSGASGRLNNRFWFTPNQFALKRYIDPQTGAATVVFDESSVQLLTESLLLGQSNDPIAQEWAEFFNTNYDAFADIAFPVQDPDDPTGQTIIDVKIFEELREVMKAVSLSRFFSDNNIPLDTWWLNSYDPQEAFIPETIPTLGNSLTVGGLTVNIFGGVQIEKPNAYIPDAVAQAIGDQVLGARPDLPGDLDSQQWDIGGTAMGDLRAVSASFDRQEQDAGIAFGVTDLSFAAPSDQPLSFDRFYNSGYLAADELGAGWQATRFELQFQLPSWTDDYGLLRDANGEEIDFFGSDYDTRLRSGAVRFVDQATGRVLEFDSSLQIDYAIDAQGNPLLSASGLTPDDVPTFTAGVRDDGSTLTQDPGSRGYTLTRPDGSTMRFDSEGNLLRYTDARGYALVYDYDEDKLVSIESRDMSGTTLDTLTLTHDADGRIETVGGPDATVEPMRRVRFEYEDGLLRYVHREALQEGGGYAVTETTQYLYNDDQQLIGIVTPDGVTPLQGSHDLRGRTSDRTDAFGNMSGYSFETDSAESQRVTVVTDMGNTRFSDPYAHGLAGIQFVEDAGSSERRFDADDRASSSSNALGQTTTFGYEGDARLPNTILLPTADRPAIEIERNGFDLPTLIRDGANAGAQPVEIVYNAQNLVERVTDETGRVTEYTYTAFNGIETVTLSAGTSLAATTTYFYDADHRLNRVTDAETRDVASYTYDDRGRVKTVTDGAGLTTTYEYDALGRLDRVYLPTMTGAIDFIEYSYNDADQLTSTTTPQGASSSIYDPATRQLTQQQDVLGRVTTYTYNSQTGALEEIRQVDAAGDRVTRQTYDRRGSVARLESPAGQVTSFRQDALGRQIALIEDSDDQDGIRYQATVQSADALRLDVTLPESASVATLKYYVEGESIASAQTLNARPNDRADVSFDLLGMDLGQSYRFELVVTDSAGETQTYDGPLDWTAPSVTIDAVTPQPAMSQPAALTIRFSEPVFGFDLGDLRVLRDGTPVDMVDATLTSTNQQTWQLSGLGSLGNDPAVYTIEIGEAGAVITDLAGNALLSSAYASWAVSLPGDTDGDADIDDADLGTAFSNFTGPVGAAGGKTAAQGDTDGDGDVDDADLGTAFSNFTGPLGPNAEPPFSQMLAAWLELGQQRTVPLMKNTLSLFELNEDDTDTYLTNYNGLSDRLLAGSIA